MCLKINTKDNSLKQVLCYRAAFTLHHFGGDKRAALKRTQHISIALSKRLHLKYCDSDV